MCRQPGSQSEHEEREPLRAITAAAGVVYPDSAVAAGR